MFNLFKSKEKEIKSRIKEKSFREEILSFLKDLLIIGIIVVVIRSFFVLPFQISGQSMYESYYDKEFIIVDVLSYLETPLFNPINPHDRGDVIVFKPHVNEEREYFIKRIIGIEGDRVKITGGKVYLKPKGEEYFVEIDELYLSDINKGSTFTYEEESIYEVPEDSFFVMGDNRTASTDSRNCFSSCIYPNRTNYINKGDIVGKVFLDLGYFNFRTFSFIHPVLGIDTTPKWFGSPREFVYDMSIREEKEENTEENSDETGTGDTEK